MGMQGRVTLPIEVRRELQLAAGAEFEVEVVDGRIVFSPADPFPREDAWAYTPERRTLVARARQDVAEGWVYRPGRDDVEALVAEADARE
jgi:AbrB family looped-hinge helix DNA binding protein